MMKKAIFICIACFFFLADTAFSFWVWTPESGRWINPKYAVAPTPQEQLERALELYQQDNLKAAEAEFRKLLTHYSESAEAAEAQYYQARIREKEGRLYEAYQAYQKVVDKYPFTLRLNEIIERQFKIGEEFLQGHRRRTFGVALPVENPAIEIFTTVVANSTFGPFAAEAQYKLGLVLKGLGRSWEAQEAFNKVIVNYPDSDWAKPAEFQAAACQARLASGTDYDQEALRQAKKKFEDFRLSHPESELTSEAEEQIRKLAQQEAQGNFDIAAFYEKQRAYRAAKIYYNKVIQQAADSKLAAEALSKIQALERKGKDAD